MQKYLESTQYINWQHSDVLKQAKLLAGKGNDQEHIAKVCF